MRDPIESVPDVKRLEQSVDIEQPALVMTKNGREVIGRVRVIQEVGLELRYLVDGELRHSQIFKDWPALEHAANAKRVELLALGWSDQ